MHYSQASVLLGAACLVAAAPGTAHPIRDSCGPVAKVLYSMTNVSPNQVISIPVNDNGTLSEVSFTPTGGNGRAYLAEGGQSGASTFDALESGDPIVRSGNFLYLVNAGSDSVSVLAINPEDPTNLTLVGTPTALEGEFPVTLAVSEELGLLCVGTTGVKNGVECFQNSPAGQLTPDGQGLRSLNLNVTTPPSFGQGTLSDVFFSQDNTKLYAPVKGNSTINGTSDGFVSVYFVENGSVAAKGVRSTPQGIALLYAGIVVPGNSSQIFVSEATYGAVVLGFDSEGNANLVGSGAANPAVAALCWAEYSEVSKSAWVTSVGSNSLLAFDVNTAEVLGQTNITNPNGGITDLTVPGEYLYGLAAGATNGTVAGIAVVDISKGSTMPETVQFFSIGNGVNNYAAGLVWWA